MGGGRLDHGRVLDTNELTLSDKVCRVGRLEKFVGVARKFSRDK